MLLVGYWSAILSYRLLYGTAWYALAWSGGEKSEKTCPVDSIVLENKRNDCQDQPVTGEDVARDNNIIDTNKHCPVIANYLLW